MAGERLDQLALLVGEVREQRVGEQVHGAFDASDAVVLDIVFGRAEPSGALPFELPSSMEAARDQLPDVPYDSADPLFPFGHGLRYRD